MTKDDEHPQEIALRLMAKVCGNGSCPTIYRTDRGTLVIQGFPLSPAAAGIDVPDGETLVEIPESLLGAAAREVT
jgi:hypothetical protein